MVESDKRYRFFLYYINYAILIFTLYPSIGLCSRYYDLTELSIEELMNIEVTSVSKKPQKLSEAAAAVFVITAEDIRRSGATSIPGALRMVPGLQVAKIDANKWAVTSRGFNGRFANKLLVLIDGRSVYTPLYSGVYWDVQDTLLEDLDRIEIIRGPGATLWGANAVNGVINIITKPANETQGSMVIAGIGTEERVIGSARYGTKSGEGTFYRVYAKYFKRDDAVFASGDDSVDKWDMLRGGFRLDRRISGSDVLTVIGNIYDGQAGGIISAYVPVFETSDEPDEIDGANLLGRWEHLSSDSSDLTLQVYYDRTNRETFLIQESRDTVDVDLQHRFSLGKRHGIIWGLGYRFTRDDIDNTPSITIDPDRRHDDLFSAFAQDDISFLENRLRLTLGSKFEYNDYTGFEIQPNARLIWIPDGLCSIWGAVSRAVRTPSRGEPDGRLTVFAPGLPLNAITLVLGDKDFKSEDLMAYELGYRARLRDSFSLDMAVFFNDYRNLRSFGSVNTSTIPFEWPGENGMKAKTYGGEIAAYLAVSDWWRLHGAYTYLQMQLDLPKDRSQESLEDENPHHQISLRSSMDLPRNFELDLWARYVDNLPAQGVGSYATVDVRIGWKPCRDIELTIVGQNLLDSHHPEFIPEIFTRTPTETERGVYGKITWQF